MYNFWLLKFHFVLKGIMNLSRNQCSSVKWCWWEKEKPQCYNSYNVVSQRIVNVRKYLNFSHMSWKMSLFGLMPEFKDSLLNISSACICSQPAWVCWSQMDRDNGQHMQRLSLCVFEYITQGGVWICSYYFHIDAE